MEKIENYNIKNNLLVKVLTFSFLVHILFLFVHFQEKPSKALLTEKTQKLIVKLMTKKTASQIVETTDQNKIKPIDPKFLGKSNHKVKRETKNRNIGTFNIAAKGKRNAVNKKDTRLEKVRIKKKLKNLKLSDLALNVPSFQKAVVKKKRAKLSATRKGLKNGKEKGRALGQSSDHLEDIPLGDFTKLNTQEYQFYGFYHRIRQKLEQFWGNNLREQADSLFKQGRSIASDTNLVTGLRIKIDSKGKIVDIGLNSTSGMKELDDAAIKSFNQAGPFPNPPKGMLGKDGKAIIEWGFVVNT